MQIPRQNIDIKRLNTFGIYELRNFARALGVPRPTTLLRNELIEQICLYMESGESEETGETGKPKKSRGRPPRNKNLNIAQVIDPEPYCPTILEMPDEPPAYTFSVASGIQVTEQTRTGSGFIHTVPRGHGVLISSCLNTYHVPIKLITANRLDTGDYVEVRAVWNDQDKRYHVEEILNVTRTNFCTAPSIRPHKPAKIQNFDFNLGSRVVLTSARKLDFVNYIAAHHKDIKNVHKIALLIEESDDCVDFLIEKGLDEAYLVKVNFSTKKKVMLALTALFNAKRHAADGKDVVVFTDNLNKLYKLYNSSVHDKGSIDISQINIGPLTDLKTFFMSSKQLKDSGSLTIISHVYKPSTQVENYIIDEFTNLANVVIELI